MENLENFICKIAIKMYMRSILTIFFGGKQYPEIPALRRVPGTRVLKSGPEPTFENRNQTGRTGNFATRSTTNSWYYPRIQFLVPDPSPIL